MDTIINCNIPASHVHTHFNDSLSSNSDLFIYFPTHTPFNSVDVRYSKYPSCIGNSRSINSNSRRWSRHKCEITCEIINYVLDIFHFNYTHLYIKVKRFSLSNDKINQRPKNWRADKCLSHNSSVESGDAITITRIVGGPFTRNVIHGRIIKKVGCIMDRHIIVC